MNTNKSSIIRILLLTVALDFTACADAADQPFVGNWALTLPGGTPGWLGVTQKADRLDASLLWGWGSVTPLNGVAVTNHALVFTRVSEVARKDEHGKVLRTERVTNSFTATVDGDELKIVNDAKKEFSGRRLPPLPPAPDLAKVKFGDAISLFNGTDLSGWHLTSPKAVSGWSVVAGSLVNRVVHEEGKPHQAYSNIQTDREFTDFNLTLETRVPKNSNSGIFLRGVYEIQIFDSYGKQPSSLNMGALYSRITPSSAAEKPGGEWQALDITLVARHLTVILNGVTIIANQPVLGITGGAISADEFKPGPLLLQGDHSNAEYRNFQLRPVVN